MRKILRKFAVLSLVVVVFLSFIGCSSASKNSSKEKKQTQDVKNEDKELKITEDKKSTEKLKEKEEVLSGKVYTQDGNAIATIIIKDSVSESDAKLLAEDYAKQLKKQYSGMKVNVQAVQKGKNIANITIDK